MPHFGVPVPIGYRSRARAGAVFVRPARRVGIRGREPGHHLRQPAGCRTLCGTGRILVPGHEFVRVDPRPRDERRSNLPDLRPRHRDGAMLRLPFHRIPEVGGRPSHRSIGAGRALRSLPRAVGGARRESKRSASAKPGPHERNRAERFVRLVPSRAIERRTDHRSARPLERAPSAFAAGRQRLLPKERWQAHVPFVPFTAPAARDESDQL